MNIIMNTNRIVSIGDIERFLQGANKIDFCVQSKKEKYHFISDTLVRAKYNQLRKKECSLLIKYLKKITGYSNRQIDRLIFKWKKGELISSLSEVKENRNTFPCKYGPTEIGLLARADEALNFPNGHALKKSLVREYEVFKKEEYLVISQISVSHIYNMRNNSLQYQSKTMHYTKTSPVNVPIGERRKPDNQGIPGYLRVDSVHQGDFNGVKGIYHINIIDEVTQWEVVGCVELISDKFLIPLLEDLINCIPFEIVNFHSDNSSEYINYQVADMLNRLMNEIPRSRAGGVSGAYIRSSPSNSVSCEL